jgi:hypothetical protein
LAIGAEEIKLMNFEGRPEKGLPFSFVWQQLPSEKSAPKLPSL